MVVDVILHLEAETSTMKPAYILKNVFMTLNFAGLCNVQA